jgi:hypothetical protein
MGCRKWEVQVLKRHEGTQAPGAEARLMRHLELCARCRTLAEKFSELDSLFSTSREPSLPPFLKERIVICVSEAMRQDAVKGVFSRFFGLFVSFRPAVAGAVLVLGIGLGVISGWNLARSMTGDGLASSHDLLSLAGFGDPGGGSFLEFILTDSNGRTGQ